MTKTKKHIQTLKAAPAWKRFCAYLIDSVFLFIILVLLITGIYGQELVMLLDNIYQYGSQALTDINITVSQNILDSVSNLTPREQSAEYLMLAIQSKYSQSIFMLNQILSILYFGIFWWSTGQTIGAKIFKIKVIAPLKDRIPIFSLLVRVTVLKLAETALGLPLLVITNRVLKQRVHDSLSSTVVVEEFSEEEEELIEKLSNEKFDDEDEDRSYL